MIELIATAESIKQAEQLIDVGVDKLYIGEDMFGLRLPASFTTDGIASITEMAHDNRKKVRVAINAIMHNQHIKHVIPYIKKLEEIGVDEITVGDPGVIHLMKKNAVQLPYIYDAQTMVTSAKQINFWEKRGAKGAVLAREIPYEELMNLAKNVNIPVEILVYGATCIHQSLRPLLKNYMNFTEQAMQTKKESNLFLSEKKDPTTHYSVYEDRNGTHIFATNDVNLLPYLNQLADIGLTTWKLDGLFTRGEAFVKIAEFFVQAKRHIMENSNSPQEMQQLQENVKAYHPKERTLDAGFFTMKPSDVK